MKIGINASSFRRPDTGMGQVTANFVKSIIKLNEHKYFDSNPDFLGVEFFLYLEEDIDLKLPKNFHKRVFLPKFQRRDDLIRKILWEKFLLPKKIKRDDCDLLISLYQSSTVIKGVKHRMIVHDMIWKVFPEYLDNWRKKLYATLCFRAILKADHIISISDWSKRDIHKYLKIPFSKISVAYPSVDKNFYAESNPDTDNKILEKYDIYGRYIFYIGGFDFRKNISGLLEAYEILRKKYNLNEINLVLGGEDKSRFSKLFTDLEKEIGQRKLKNSVKITGFIEQKDLPSFYRQAELFILPSLYEGFGLMALEAMASGTPTAVSKSSSLPEVGGDAVLYFNPYDSAEMAKVMHKILSNNKIKQRLSGKGKERAKKFKWENFVEKILAWHN